MQNSKQKNLDIPVLLMVFNRIDTTINVLDAIRQARPKKLYIACDGARKEKYGEYEKVEEIRRFVVNNINWRCRVETLFRKSNLGCKESVNDAISWFFENEEMGVILEDDTVPDISFFWYCQELLIKYKNDTRIGLISGNNHMPWYQCQNSYVFSKFKKTWGWATWRRSWVNQDLEMSWEKTPYKESIIGNMGYSNKKTFASWLRKIEDVNTNRVNTWDYQWFLALSSQSQLCIFPAKNLVANIGFGGDATHCVGDASSEYSSMHSIEFPLRHPKYFVPELGYEKNYEMWIVKKKRVITKIIPPSVRKQLKNIIKRFYKYK